MGQVQGNGGQDRSKVVRSGSMHRGGCGSYQGLTVVSVIFELSFGQEMTINRHILSNNPYKTIEYRVFLLW